MQSTHYTTQLPGAAHWSLIMRRGTEMRLTDLEGGANVGMLLYNPHNPLERYNADCWALRTRYQGIAPPFERTEGGDALFDAIAFNQVEQAAAKAARDLNLVGDRALESDEGVDHRDLGHAVDPIGCGVARSDLEDAAGTPTVANREVPGIEIDLLQHVRVVDAGEAAKVIDEGNGDPVDERFAVAGRCAGWHRIGVIRPTNTRLTSMISSISGMCSVARGSIVGRAAPIAAMSAW